jgi:hypothetical protein
MTAIDLLTQTLKQLAQGMNNSEAAQWFGLRLRDEGNA